MLGGDHPGIDAQNPALQRFGHPAAPVYGSLKSDGSRLTGTLHFAPDNDPAPTDYAELVAFDKKGQAKAFRLSLMDDSYGRTSWSYGGLVAYQHMRYDFGDNTIATPFPALAKRVPAAEARKMVRAKWDFVATRFN